MPQAEFIDGFAFARAGKPIAGMLTLADMPRLAGSGCDRADLSYTVRGGLNARGKPNLVIQATGTVELICQRCLEPVGMSIELDSDLELCSSETEIAAAADEIDRVLAGERMDVVGLVEDEVLLALPMVPKHESCEPAIGAGKSGQRSPFGRLASLKTDH